MSQSGTLAYSGISNDKYLLEPARRSHCNPPGQGHRSLLQMKCKVGHDTAQTAWGQFTSCWVAGKNMQRTSVNTCNDVCSVAGDRAQPLKGLKNATKLFLTQHNPSWTSQVSQPDVGHSQEIQNLQHRHAQPWSHPSRYSATTPFLVNYRT